MLSTDKQYTGYIGRVLEFLKKNDIKISDSIQIDAELDFQGILMARFDHGGDQHIVLKLKNGYNVEIDILKIKSIQKTNEPGKIRNESKVYKTDPRLKKILILATGGTIASKIDYRTGAVTPTLNMTDLLESVPEAASLANIDYKVLMSKYSENMTPNDWIDIATQIDKYATMDYAGIVIAHGTDTMQYTASFLAFALLGYPKPIVLVGSQRSSDRPSSDAALNLVGAIKFVTKIKTQGVYVAMHQNENDDTIACHIATRVRKNHSSKRGAFETVGDRPKFLIKKNIESKDHVQNIQYTPNINLSTKVLLVKYYPGYDPRQIITAIESDMCKAIIFEGTGLGHVGYTLYPCIKLAKEKKIFMGMTSQCIDGTVNMSVYESGRDLVNLGITPLNDMLPEVALVKAMWVLGTTQKIEEIENKMQSNIAHEINTRRN